MCVITAVRIKEAGFLYGHYVGTNMAGCINMLYAWKTRAAQLFCHT